MAENYVKIGDKQKHLVIPEGYYLLGDDDIIRKDDKVANVQEFYWMTAEPEEDYGYSVKMLMEGGGFAIRRIKI